MKIFIQKSIYRSNVIFIVTIAFLTFIFSSCTTATADGLQEGFKIHTDSLLFNGINFDGWRGINKKHFPKKGWQVIDSCITNTGENGGSIITEKKYDNFELVWEWRMVTPGANSGLKYFVVERKGDKGGYGYGIEFQLLDDADHEWMKNGKMKPNDYHTLGAAYELYEPSPDKKAKKLGKWNKCKLVSDNGKIEHWLNGKKILEYNRFSDDFKQKVSASKFKDVENFGLHKKGHILLQDHNSKIYFRNIKIKTL
jgi:hypothetical protein